MKKLRPNDGAAPTPEQQRLTEGVVRWYLHLYHGHESDPGSAAMFCSPERVGPFAVSREALASGEPSALFKVLVGVTMFQRLADQLILKILREMDPTRAAALTEPTLLLQRLDASGCPHAVSQEALLSCCDLTKDAQGRGCCRQEPERRCGLKEDTETLKRYGHFGKVPSSLALVLREAAVSNLGELRERCIEDGCGDPDRAALLLEQSLRRAWRVSDKIAAMFLSLVSNPELSPGLAPWSSGLNWKRWVVIDSNVDLFLRQTGYPGPWTYPARQRFVELLAAGIDLSRLKPGLSAYNPRLVQQALYLFTSVTNRRALSRDCSHQRPSPCSACEVSSRCGLKSGEGSAIVGRSSTESSA